MFRAAFYKGTRPGIPGIYNRLVRAWDGGPYSHEELIFSDGMAASASFMDKGVRFKQIDFNPDKWDFIELPAHLEAGARQWFIDHEFQPDGSRTSYDLIGQSHFLYAPYRGNDKAYWCTKSTAAALGMPDPWRYGPNGHAAALRFAVGIESQPATAGFFILER